MKRAEKIIRNQITDLSIDRIAPRMNELRQAITWMYWQGTFRKKKYLLMLQLLENRYSEIMNKYEEKLKSDSDRDYEVMKQRYGLE